MVAELLERRDLRANGHKVSVNLYLVRPGLDREAASSGRLEANEQNEIPGIRQSLREMMQDASAGDHAARRDDHRGHHGVIDFLRLLRSRCECEAGPGQW